ncbi:MAG: alpha/beta hydrolase [Tidjanibacter sp.]|nr:alpha/beta hydrolase [Tidjanibacter sp.]
MKQIFLTTVMLVAAFCLQAAEPFKVKLYPNGPKESTYVTEPETNVNNRLRNVTEPRMEVFLPEGESTGRFVVICPGGGYVHITIESEGYEVARWLNKRGIAAGVLTYRTPNTHGDATINDVLRAVELTRENAAEWKVDPAKVGVMGFSAGGHLASMAVTKYNSEKNRPDFGILIYPVITLNMGKTHAGSRLNLLGEVSDEVADKYSAEKLVNSNTPTCFLAHCDDDRAVPPYNSISFYAAMKEHGVKGELHVYPRGGHGWGFLNPFPMRAEFDASLERWLKGLDEPEPQFPRGPRR